MGNRFGRSVRQSAMALMLAAGLVSGAANALFIDQGGGVVLDTTTNLEWEQNANHGPFDWIRAVAYANTLALDGGGWHLADIGELPRLYEKLITAGLCTGENCTGSIGLFTDILPAYWSGTKLQFDSPDAWDYRFDLGYQDYDFILNPLSAWAVRRGDVVADAPEPASLLLLGVGALGLGWSRQRIGSNGAPPLHRVLK